MALLCPLCQYNFTNDHDPTKCQNCREIGAGNTYNFVAVKLACAGCENSADNVKCRGCKRNPELKDNYRKDV
jgi:hypothetical protein